jgi:imidazolonepropionase-like amidohydrolase
MHFAGLDLRAAVNMATKHPADLLGLPVASLRPGDKADLALFDLSPAAGGDEQGELQVRATLADGRIVYGNLVA